MESLTNSPSNATLISGCSERTSPNVLLLLAPNSLGIGPQMERGEARGAKPLPEETHGSQNPGEGRQHWGFKVSPTAGVRRGKRGQRDSAVALGILVIPGWNREPRARLLREQQEQHPQHPPCGAGSIGTIW